MSHCKCDILTDTTKNLSRSHYKICCICDIHSHKQQSLKACYHTLATETSYNVDEQRGRQQHIIIDKAETIERYRGDGCTTAENKEYIKDVATKNIAESDTNITFACRIDRHGKFRQ